MKVPQWNAVFCVLPNNVNSKFPNWITFSTCYQMWEVFKEAVKNLGGGAFRGHVCKCGQALNIVPLCFLSPLLGEHKGDPQGLRLLLQT